MLISHTKKFIFTKTTKTASTSVEYLFEPYCLNKNQMHLLHSGKELVSSAGIVGARGKNANIATWFNHMSLKQIHSLMEECHFQDYFKFTTVRNPYDKMISLFFYLEKRKDKLQKSASNEQVPSFNINPKIKSDISRFRDWLSKNKAGVDKFKYFLNDKPAIDFFIRFESLTADLETLCNQLNIPINILNDLPHIKPGLSRLNIDISQFYDSSSKLIIEKMFGWEIYNFNYKLT